MQGQFQQHHVTASAAPLPTFPTITSLPRDGSETHQRAKNNQRCQDIGVLPNPPATKALLWGARPLRPAAPPSPALPQQSCTQTTGIQFPSLPSRKENPKIALSRLPSLRLPRQLHHHPGSRRLATPRLKILHPAPREGRRTPKTRGGGGVGWKPPQNGSNAQK